MFRWHRQTCRKPDIAIVDNVLFCSSCDSVAESVSPQLYHNSNLSIPRSDPSRSLNLRWPQSVQYSTDEEPDITPNTSTPTKITSLFDTQRRVQSALSDGTPGGRYPRLDGRCYPPLAQKYDIRLLRLSPLCSSGYLHADLDSVDLVYCPSFEALSYTWAGETGNNTKPKAIFIGPWWDIIPITVNCDMALRLLLEKGHLNIWVDSVCINQQDPRERSCQVSIMREIYSKASQVIVYLGPSADYSDDAIDALHSFSKLKPGDVEQMSTNQGIGLKNLFERRYFYRIWVIQEIAMAKSISLYCGNKGVSYPSFSNIRVPYRYIREVPWLMRYIEGGSTMMRDPEGLLQLLDATSKCAASDPRDTVFAVLGLLRDGIFEGLVPDYCLSREQVYIGIASYLICHHMKTEILLYEKGYSRSLPTWVPDWSVYRQPKTRIDADADDDDGIAQFNPGRDSPPGIKTVKPNIQASRSLPGEDGYSRLYYSNDLAVIKRTTVNTIWLKGDGTTWTLFSTNKTRSPCIRYLSRHIMKKDGGATFDTRPTVNASTGALTIKSTIIARFESFEENDQCEFVRTVPFLGIQEPFQWVLKADNPVDTQLDVVANISGCDSYLHLRRGSTSDDYIIIGRCRAGFRQGVVRTAPTSISHNKFGYMDFKPDNPNVVDIDILGMPLHNSLLCASYGFDMSFLQFLSELLESELGKFVSQRLEEQGFGKHGSRTRGQEILRDGTGNMWSPIWKTITGWRTIIFGSANSENNKNMCNHLADLLKFWSHPTTWTVFDFIEACMGSTEDLSQTRSDWERIARSLVAIRNHGWSHNPDGRPDTTSVHLYEHNIEPQTSSRLGLPECRASLPCLISALDRLTGVLTRHLEHHSELFNDSIPGADLRRMRSQEGELSSTERIQLGRLYTNFMRNGSQTADARSQNPLLILGTEAFYDKVRSRMETLEWLRPSWLSFQERLVEFRQVCQHMVAIDAFQENIRETQKITII